MPSTNRYEALLLTVPEITADEIKTIEQQFNKTVSDKKGSVVSFERWGKYRLSFPVNKNEYGVYFLARFEGDDIEPALTDVKTLLDVKLHELVMRSMISKLDAKGSLEYQRPQSLEEAPAREVGSFMKDKADSMMNDADDEGQEL